MAKRKKRKLPLMEAAIEMKFDAVGFEKVFPNIVKTARNIEPIIRDRSKHVIVTKPVKSGARRLIECLAERNKETSDKEIRHVYVTKLDRTDINPQISEMESYGIKCYKIQKNTDVELLISDIDEALSQGYIVWIHLDEGDYGTAEDQLIAPFFQKYVNGNAVFIDYSASNEEAILSAFNEKNFSEVVELEPGPYYKGAKWFLENGLVQQAVPFWDFNKNEITRQGNECISKLNNTKLFGVVRLVGKEYDKAYSRSFVKFFEDLGIKVVFVDKDNKFAWGNKQGDGERWKSFLHEKQKVLIVINQTCTRSTEVGFHEFIAFWHDHRNKETPYNTRIQAYGRIFHYDSIGHAIYAYMDVDTFRLAAKDIPYNQYPFKISARVRETVKRTKEKVLVLNDLISRFGIESMKSVRNLSKEEDSDRSQIKMFMEGNSKDGSHLKKLKHMPSKCERDWFIPVSNYAARNVCRSIDGKTSEAYARNLITDNNNKGIKKIGFYLDETPSVKVLEEYISSTPVNTLQAEFKADLEAAGASLSDSPRQQAEKLFALYNEDFEECAEKGRYVVSSVSFLNIDKDPPKNPADFRSFLDSTDEYILIEDMAQLDMLMFNRSVSKTCRRVPMKGSNIVGRYHGTLIDSKVNEKFHEAKGSMYNNSDDEVQ